MSAKKTNGCGIPVSDLRLFEIFFDGDESEESIIEIGDQYNLLVAKKRLHYDPGVNPFDQRTAARAVVMRIGKPRFLEPSVWLRPGRSVQDAQGVSILAWEDFSILWPIPSDVDPRSEVGPARDWYAPEKICLEDLRQVEISTSQGRVGAIVCKNDVQKFLESQQYLGRIQFESHDGERIARVNSFPEASVVVRAINVYSLGFYGPYWHTSPDLENGFPRGARIVLSRRRQVVFDRHKN
ncbi:MAG: hypothetical protein NTX14_03030 [Candidatus Nealsonbacteria bacterium]|nr:hypothetical protein [Candidatus Nealsonbacteria bacterium]